MGELSGKKRSADQPTAGPRIVGGASDKGFRMDPGYLALLSPETRARYLESLIPRITGETDTGERFGEVGR